MHKKGETFMKKVMSGLRFVFRNGENIAISN